MVNLPVLQALSQFLRRNVYQLHLSGIIKNIVRDSFIYPHMGNGCHDVMKALQVLHIDRGVHVDSGVQQLNHILVALFVTAALGIGMGQLIHQNQIRPSHKGRIQVKFLQDDSLIRYRHWGQQLHSGQQLHCIRPVMGLYVSGHHIPSRCLFLPGSLQHGVCLAYSGRVSEEYFKPSPCLVTFPGKILL